MIAYLEFQKLLKEGLVLSYDITRYGKSLSTFLDQLNIKHQIIVIDKLEFF